MNPPQMGDVQPHDYYYETLKRLADFLPYEDWAKFTIEFANVRLEQLESTWKNLQMVYLETENGPSLADARRIYVQCKTTLQRHILELRSAEMELPTPSEVSELTVDINESELDLLNEIGIFDGDFTKWSEFHNRFVAKVHTDAFMRNSQKLNMLKTALTERAARVLGRWQLTDANYELAWNKLCGVYNNQYQIARAHIQSLQTMPRLQPATFDGIFALIDKVMYAQRQLVEMGVRSDKWDLMIIYLVEERLDDRSRHAWADYRQNNAIILPNWDEMMEFLKRRASELPQRSSLSADDPSMSDSLEAESPVSTPRQVTLANGRCDEASLPNETLSKSPEVEGDVRWSVRAKSRWKPLPMIERKRRRRRRRQTFIGTGEDRMNTGLCIECKAHKKIRFVNCKECPARGHFTCLRTSMDAGNHHGTWRCPKCLKCAECNTNSESGTLFKCTACHKRYHSHCLENTPTPEAINIPGFKCDKCVQPYEAVAYEQLSSDDSMESPEI